MNYRLEILEREGLVAGYLVIIFGVYVGQERCAGALSNVYFKRPILMVAFFSFNGRG